jgi:hypothetical protein
LDAAGPVRWLTPRANVARMEKDIRIDDADLELLLAEADREEPFLVARRPPEAAQAPREELDEQILAGLVTPY